MSEPAISRPEPPFLSAGPAAAQMAIWTLGALTVLAGLYAGRYEPRFFLKYLAVLAVGAGLGIAYTWLREGRFRLRAYSSMLTAGLLVVSLPPNLPAWPLFLSLIVAIVLVRMSAGEGTLPFNGVLVGRLFLMLAFNAAIVDWPVCGQAVDALSTATPLDLFHTEKGLHAIGALALGQVGGTWGDLYQLVPGSPGEAGAPVILLLGALLVWKGVLDWRCGTAFVLSFLVVCAGVNLPVAREIAASGNGSAAPLVLARILLLNLFGGALLFSAVFIAGDPASTPVSKGGRWLAGVIAGIVNALVRAYTVYPEGVVFAFLTVNLLGPALDRGVFWWRGRTLLRQRRRTQELLARRAADPRG
jgi:Na+-translocating ferredoxin:NAD+ oxidoreductase RnfD subunit